MLAIYTIIVLNYTNFTLNFRIYILSCPSLLYSEVEPLSFAICMSEAAWLPTFKRHRRGIALLSSPSTISTLDHFMYKQNTKILYEGCVDPWKNFSIPLHKVSPIKSAHNFLVQYYQCFMQHLSVILPLKKICNKYNDQGS